MKLFPTDDDLELYETGFEDDFLGRKGLSEQLSELVEKIESPIVLALDDEWGNGKTYFLKRWVGAHTKENNGKATTVYFDAFEHDYLSDPLLSIVSVISDRLPEEQRKIFAVAKSLVGNLARPAFFAALSAMTFGAKRQLDEMGDVIADVLSAEAKAFATEFWRAEQARKDAVSEFRERLVAATDGDAPALVIVIDELDRCRPDYALSILEIIKHFFSVPRVHFILGVNGVALESSVRARYGADLEAEKYLRKFINLSFSLPKSLGHDGQISVPGKYAHRLAKSMELPPNISASCVDLIRSIAKGRNVQLRDIDRILSKVAIVPHTETVENFMPGYMAVLCILICSSVIDPVFHSKFVSRKVSIVDLREFFGAPKEVTMEEFGDGHNERYDHDRAVWLYTAMHCCGISPDEEGPGAPSWAGRLDERFDRFGRSTGRDSIAARLQSEFVDLFRLVER